MEFAILSSVTLVILTFQSLAVSTIMTQSNTLSVHHSAQSIHPDGQRSSQSRIANSPSLARGSSRAIPAFRYIPGSPASSPPWSSPGAGQRFWQAMKLVTHHAPHFVTRKYSWRWRSTYGGHGLTIWRSRTPDLYPSWEERSHRELRSHDHHTAKFTGERMPASSTR